ncbi:MAG: NAD(P)-dependent alcohol dehydrogenase, partial [Myxococcales bacterium]|nr:NAD(P)-dependent alcohol dehydrogenase [Myxococcales bacterium]
LLMIDGKYNPRLALPLVPLSDGVGDVIESAAVSPGAPAVGTRVMPVFAQGWHHGLPTREIVGKCTLGGPLDGCLAEEMIVPEGDVVSAPVHLDDAEAATLPCAGVTAWTALVTEGDLKAGDSVVVQGSGGVSVFALMLAHALGARVLATTGSPEKEARLRALGADHVLNYKTEPAWGKVARAWAGGDGVDHVIDVGGAGTLPESLRAVRAGGTVSLIGILGGSADKLNLLPILMNHVRVQGVFVGHRASFEALVAFMAEQRLRPAIDRVVPFDDAPAAFAHLRSGEHFGKVGVRFA